MRARTPIGRLPGRTCGAGTVPLRACLCRPADVTVAAEGAPANLVGGELVGLLPKARVRVLGFIGDRRPAPCSSCSSFLAVVRVAAGFPGGRRV